MDRSRRIAACRPSERARRARPGVLRHRRHRADGHRRGPGAWIHRSGIFFGRKNAPGLRGGRGCGGENRLAARPGGEGRRARDHGSRGRPHGRRDQGHHDQPGYRSAREPAGGGRWGGWAEHPADRARARMPPSPRAAHGRRAQRLRRSVLRHRERVHAKQVRLHRRFSLRSGQPRAGGNHQVDGWFGGRAARARADALQARVLRGGALSVSGMGARRRVAQGRLRRAGRPRRDYRSLPSGARAGFRGQRAGPAGRMRLLAGQADRVARRPSADQDGGAARPRCRRRGFGRRSFLLAMARSRRRAIAEKISRLG